MTKVKSLITKFATATTFFFSVMLFVGANTAFSCIIHQPKVRETLCRYSEIK